MIQTTIARSGILHNLARLSAASVVALCLASPALADRSGAYASGYAFGDFRIGCTTCDHFPLELTGNPAPIDGGPGSFFAGVDYSGGPVRSSVPLDYTLGGSVSLGARASIVGPFGSPELGARVYADNVPVFIVQDPHHLEIGIDLYQASAEAMVIQRYTFIGTETFTYTWKFQVDGKVSNDQSSVFASAGFYDDFLERNLAFGSALVEGSGIFHVPTDFSTTFELTMTFNPGDSYYMRSSLSALAMMTYSSADVSADAFNTMKVISITGDTSLLVPMLKPVPEPATLALMMAGLLVIGGLGMRRSRHR